MPLDNIPHSFAGSDPHDMAELIDLQARRIVELERSLSRMWNLCALCFAVGSVAGTAAGIWALLLLRTVWGIG